MNKRISLRVLGDLYVQVQRLATIERRSINAMLVQLLHEALERRR